MSDRHADRKREQHEQWQADGRPGHGADAGSDVRGNRARVNGRAPGTDGARGSNGVGDPGLPGGADGNGEAPARTPNRWYPNLPTPPAVRPISLTGPTWHDRLDTYRGWPRWVRVASTAAVVVVLGLTALGLSGSRGSDGDNVTTSGEGLGGPFGAGVDGTGGDVTGSSTDPAPTSTLPTAAPPTSAPPDAGAGPATPASDGDSAGQGEQPAPPEGQGPEGNPDGEQGASPDDAGGPSTGDQCHPSYTGCVPVADDVDCEGRGDGPVYIGGHQQVVGPDVYGLDPDANGRTCD